MSQTTFWNLLKENKIEIPIIQRDYAQGREGKEYLRQTFLESLKEALDENKVLKLDFVYGSTENGVLQPLDGQQRLTTLWLLHWYMAMRAGKLHKAGDTLKKFTYETRISSREFCEELCKAENFESFDGNNIVSYITSQTWFYSSWKQDPTIQSMLRMLGGTQIKGKSGNDIPDGIEEVFGESSDFKKYWDKLESDNAPIVFYYLPLKDFGLSDDLYIKMNARGKQLTNFENFKADLVGYIQEKANEDETWEKFLQSENNVGIPIKLDTEWTDIFWRNKTDDGRIDEIYFAFLNRYFLYRLLQRVDSAENLQEDKIFIYLYGSNGNDTDLQYTSKAFEFDKFPELHSSLESLEKTLDNLYKSISDENSKISSEKFSAIKEAVKAPWEKDPDDNSFCFIPEYKSNIITNLTQSHRVVFFAVCKYFENKKYKEQSFKRWMRIVWNIVENSNVNNISSMQGCMKLIKELAEESFENREDNGNEDYCIYELLCTLEDGFVEKSFAKEQLKEEIEKARQIFKGNYNGNLADLKGKTWEDVIIKVENFAFFKGAIRFLFRNGNGEWDWTDFDTKWENAQRYFDKENGLYKIDSNLLRFFISQFNIENEDTNWSLFWEMVYDNEDSSWRNLLINRKWQAPIHKLLLNSKEIVSDYENYHSPFTNPAWKNVQEDLVKTDLLKHIEKSCLLHWRHENYLLAPDRAKADWKKYVIANKRNKILSQLYGGGVSEQSKEADKIYTNQKIKDCNFFWGLDIRFRFKYNNKEYTFRWQPRNRIDLYDGETRLAYNDDRAEITFDGSEVKNSDDFIKKLQDCINSWQKYSLSDNQNKS